MVDFDKSQFEVGDVVSWMGVEGIVTKVYKFDDHDCDTSLHVYFQEVKQNEYFCLDGRYLRYHTEPSLKLVHKAKKKITVECWVNVYRCKYRHTYTIAFDTKDEAEMEMCRENYLTTVHLSKEIEL